MKTCYTRYGCGTCNASGDDLWRSNEHHFIQVDRAYLVNERGVELDHPKAADPAVKIAAVGFRGWVAEPGETKCNMWQFWVKSKDEVVGRPCGASASSYMPPDAKLPLWKHRKVRGQWYPASWVPKAAVESCVALFVKP